jgi:hypothetical protein
VSPKATWVGDENTSNGAGSLCKSRLAGCARIFVRATVRVQEYPNAGWRSFRVPIALPIMTATEICAMTANPSYVTRFGNHLWICGQRIASPTTPQA